MTTRIIATLFFLFLFTAVRAQSNTNKIVNIDNKRFKLEIRVNPDKPNNENYSLSLTIKDIETGKTLYSKGFHENQYNLFKIKSDSLDVNGRLFLEVKFEGGGSGFQGKCFEISNRNNKIDIYPVYNLDELSMLYFKSDNEIIKLEGIWNFKENETHFSMHRYEITRYNYVAGKFKPYPIGKTQFKYASLDDDESPMQLLNKIKKKEPLLLR